MSKHSPFLQIFHSISELQTCLSNTTHFSYYTGTANSFLGHYIYLINSNLFFIYIFGVVLWLFVFLPLLHRYIVLQYRLSSRLEVVQYQSRNRDDELNYIFVKQTPVSIRCKSTRCIHSIWDISNVPQTCYGSYILQTYTTLITLKKINPD